ncbi:MAG: glycosyltransferase family 2 protein [Luteolibacter sp.]
MIVALNLILIALVLVFLYTWFGYPVLLAFLAKNSSPSLPEDTATDTVLPHVHIIIAAHNEAEIITHRIRNLRALDYPCDKMSAYIGTDGCTDETAVKAREAAAGDDRIRILEFTENRGKTTLLREMVSHIREAEDIENLGALLVFSDANTMFAPDAMRNLAEPFRDSAVGGVCGKLVFTRVSTADGKVSENPAEEGLYWRLETKLKTWESALDSCLGANGAIYAIRPALFWDTMPPNTIVDDFVIGMKVREQGCRMLYVPTAVATEELPEVADEWVRRVRIGAGNYQSLGFLKSCLGLRFGFFAWAFWSHKVLRWFTPHLIIAMTCVGFPLCVYFLICGGGLVEMLPAFAVAVFLVSLVVAGQAGRLMRKWGYEGFVGSLCGACDHFVTMHVALFAGWLRFCGGGMSGTWKRTPR